MSGSGTSCGPASSASSSRANPTQLRSRERVDAIFEATRELLRKGGIDRCTVANIATQAEITPASLYRYFPDATSIIRALAEATLDELHRELVNVVATISEAADVVPVLNAALDGYVSHFTNDRSLRELWFGTLADAQLTALNVADSRRNGELIANAIAPYSSVPLKQLRDRWFLISHMIGAAVGLTLELPPAEAKRLQREFRTILMAPHRED